MDKDKNRQEKDHGKEMIRKEKIVRMKISKGTTGTKTEIRIRKRSIQNGYKDRQKTEVKK
jgi:hypothetical protein